MNPCSFLVLELLSSRQQQRRVSPSRSVSRLLLIMVILALRTGTASYGEETEKNNF